MRGRSRTANRLLRARLQFDRSLSTRQQRDLLFESERSLLKLSDSSLARLEGLHPPSHLKARHELTIEVWGANAEIHRRYAQLLTGVVSNRDFLVATQYDSSAQTQLDRNSLTAVAGLRYLADGRCRLERQRFARPITLANADPVTPLVPGVAPLPAISPPAAAVGVAEPVVALCSDRG